MRRIAADLHDKRFGNLASIHGIRNKQKKSLYLNLTAFIMMLRLDDQCIQQDNKKFIKNDSFIGKCRGLELNPTENDLQCTRSRKFSRKILVFRVRFSHSE